MPLEKGQRVLPTIAADADSRPMTSKQARKAHQERLRGPKLTKEQRWSEERRLQAEIKRDIKRRDEEDKKAQERERNQLRAKMARDRAKLKEEAENAAKRKAGKPLRPPRPSQASILGFMLGNAAAKKRSMVEEPNTKLSVIREESGSPTLSTASVMKRRRLSDVNITTDSPGPEEQPTEQPAVEEGEVPPEGSPEPEEETDDVPPLSLGRHALPEMSFGQETHLGHEDVPLEENAEPDEETDNAPPLSLDNLAPPEASSGQETDPDPPRSGQQQPEPEQEPEKQEQEPERKQESESRTASASPTPVSSPRAGRTARNVGLTISFSLDDFEDALSSAAQLDKELQGPDNTPSSDQAVEDTKTDTSGPRDDAPDDAVKDTKTATSGAREGAQDMDRTVPKAKPDLMTFLPFLSTQDCSFSEADITEIETPKPSIPGPRRRTLNSATPTPRQPTMGPPRPPLRRPPTALHTPSRQNHPPQLHRSPLAPIQNSAFPTSNTRVKPPTKPPPAVKAPPALPANLTEEDLSALQSEDWDDDLSLGKGPSPRPRRSPAPQTSHHHDQATVGLSSSDIRTLASADWSDDL